MVDFGRFWSGFSGFLPVGGGWGQISTPFCCRPRGQSRFFMPHILNRGGVKNPCPTIAQSARCAIFFGKIKKRCAMDDETPPFAVDHAVAEKAVKIGGDVKSPKIPPFADLSRDEKKIWEYICSQLREAEIEHLTSGLAISIIVKTFRRWMDAEDRLTAIENENFGTYIIETPNGHAQPHQAFYVARSLKAELLKWLPECCLTIPSLVTARQKIGAKPPMDDLFGDMQNHAASHPSAEKAALH